MGRPLTPTKLTRVTAYSGLSGAKDGLTRRDVLIGAAGTLSLAWVGCGDGQDGDSGPMASSEGGEIGDGSADGSGPDGREIDAEETETAVTEDGGAEPGALVATEQPTFMPVTPPGAVIGSVWSITDGSVTGGTSPYTKTRRILRSGEPQAFGTFTSYTIVDADAGHSLEAEVLYVDSSNPAKSLLLRATGVAVIPGGNVSVVGPDTFLDALIASTQSAEAHTLVCKPGDYPRIFIANGLVKPGARTTILAQDRNAPPTWRDTEFIVDGMRNFTFDGIHFVNTRVDALGFPDAGDPAFMLNDCQDITIRNCTFNGWHRSFTSRRSVNLVVEWNKFTRWGMDTCRLFGRHQNLIIRNNLWIDPWIDWERATSDDPNRHPDCISIQIGADTDRGCIDVLIEQNDITTGNGYCQGIFVANANVVAGDSFDTYKHQNVTIQDNITTTRHTNAIFMAGIDGVLCQRNIVREFPVVGEPVWTGLAAS